MFYFCTTKKRLIIVASILAVLLSTVTVMTVTALAKGGTPVDRVEFLKTLGYTVDSKYKEEQQEIDIPEEFSDVYNNYNELQKRNGYDLSKYKGFSLTQYTLKIDDAQQDNIFAHILVYKNKIVGGDISSTSIDGTMKGLNNET